MSDDELGCALTRITSDDPTPSYESLIQRAYIRSASHRQTNDVLTGDPDNRYLGYVGSAGAIPPAVSDGLIRDIGFDPDADDARGSMIIQERSTMFVATLEDCVDVKSGKITPLVICVVVGSADALIDNEDDLFEHNGSTYGFNEDATAFGETI